MAASVNHELGEDSRDLARQCNQGAQLQLTRRLTLGMLGQQPLQGQAFVRLARQGQRQDDSVFDLRTDWRSWWVDFGLSFNFQ